TYAGVVFDESTRRAAPIMRGAPREGALRVAEQRLAAGGAQHSPDPQLLRPAEERQLHHQRFSFQVYLSRLPPQTGSGPIAVVQLWRALAVFENGPRSHAGPGHLPSPAPRRAWPRGRATPGTSTASASQRPSGS